MPNSCVACISTQMLWQCTLQSASLTCPVSDREVESTADEEMTA